MLLLPKNIQSWGCALRAPCSTPLPLLVSVESNIAKNHISLTHIQNKQWLCRKQILPQQPIHVLQKSRMSIKALHKELLFQGSYKLL